MLIGSNLNPYKKLLETTETEYNEMLYESLLRYLEDLIKLMISSVMEFDSVEAESEDNLVLETFGYNDNKLKNANLSFIDDYAIINKNPIFNNINIASIELIDEFIKESVTSEIHDFDEKILDKYVKLIDKNFINIRDYIILGRYTGLPHHENVKIPNNVIKLVNGENINLFTLIRELPDSYLEKITIKIEYIGNFPFIVNQIKSDSSIEEVTIEFEDLIDYDISYPVGIKKDIFANYYIDFLKSKRIIGFQSEDNSIWEDEEE
jgi:hypothetical protein